MSHLPSRSDVFALLTKGGQSSYSVPYIAEHQAKRQRWNSQFRAGAFVYYFAWPVAGQPPILTQEEACPFPTPMH
jgi:hypothetical protein